MSFEQCGHFTPNALSLTLPNCIQIPKCIPRIRVRDTLCNASTADSSSAFDLLWLNGKNIQAYRPKNRNRVGRVAEKAAWRDPVFGFFHKRHRRSLVARCAFFSCILTDGPVRRGVVVRVFTLAILALAFCSCADFKSTTAGATQHGCRRVPGSGDPT